MKDSLEDILDFQKEIKGHVEAPCVNVTSALNVTLGLEEGVSTGLEGMINGTHADAEALQAEAHQLAKEVSKKIILSSNPFSYNLYEYFFEGHRGTGQDRRG